MRSSEAASEAEQSRALECDLGFTLGAIFRGYFKAAEAVVNAIPGGPRGYQVLAAATQHQADGQGALAQRLGVDRTVMTYLIDDLERAGLVERRPDPVDRRSRRIVATSRGQQLWADTEERLQQVEEQLLAPLSAPEQASFRGMLQRVAARANAVVPVSSACGMIDEVTSALEPVKTPAHAPSGRRRSPPQH